MSETWTNNGTEGRVMSGAALFRTLADQDYLHLSSSEGKTNGAKVVELLSFKKEDVSKAARIPVNSVRYDEKMPRELEERLTEWAVLLNLVAQFFQGDSNKTILWFNVPNPLLGDIKPKDMIRFGRSRKLFNFVFNALNENEQEARR